MCPPIPYRNDRSKLSDVQETMEIFYVVKLSDFVVCTHPLETNWIKEDAPRLYQVLITACSLYTQEQMLTADVDSGEKLDNVRQSSTEPLH